jgi:hypothetical protein
MGRQIIPLSRYRPFCFPGLNKGVIARSEATCLRAEALRRASVAISWDCFTEFTLSKIMRFFAEPVLSRKKRFFASLRMTLGEGLRMTKSEGFAMTPRDDNLFMTFTIDGIGNSHLLARPSKISGILYPPCHNDNLFLWAENIFFLIFFKIC